MRITGGEYGGRIIESPRDRSIRPTSDKVRLAIFNILEARDLVRGAVVLDAFCGTGALGIESISRGALCCTFVDKNRGSLDLCRKNYAALKIPAHSNFILKDTLKMSAKPAAIPSATLLFLDPPYRQGLALSALRSLREGGWMDGAAHVLVEAEAGYDISSIQALGLEWLLTRDYGDTRVALFRI